MAFDLNSAKALIESGMSEAQDMLRDPIKIDNLMISVEDALKKIPVAGETLADIPLMISMVKSYITKEYTDVSLKVIITMVSTFIYFVKKKDLIPDTIPVAGQIDDLAVLKFAMSFVRPELDAYSQWRDARRAGQNRKMAETDTADADAAKVDAAEAGAAALEG